MSFFFVLNSLLVSCRDGAGSRPPRAPSPNSLLLQVHHRDRLMWYSHLPPSLLYSDAIWFSAMSSHRSHVACHAALGSTVDPLHGLISLGLVDWDGRNQAADSAVDGLHLATTLAERLLTLHEGVVLEISSLARQGQALASSLDLLIVAHNERLGRLESRCFEQERELGELRVRMLELELAWEQWEFQASSGYASVVSTLARQAQTLASSLDLLTSFHSKRLGRLKSHCFEMDREMGELRVQMMELELAWEQRNEPSSSGYISLEDGVVVEEGVVGEEMEMGEEGLWSPTSSDRAILALVPDAPAMELWSLVSIESRLKPPNTYRLVPSADGLENNVPPKSRTQVFRRKREAFFPEPGTVLKKHSHWQSIWGEYVKDYHKATELSWDYGKSIKDTLDKIFQNLQVLPFNPGRPDNMKPLWRWIGDQLQLLFNLLYLQLLDRVLRYKGRAGKGKRQHGKNKLRPKVEFKALVTAKHMQVPQRQARVIQ
ncbi:hypothetical protein BDM02DRAFT_3192660, partial [Thelephora ganbajun]